MKKLHVAIQGIEGSFHDEAVKLLFPGDVCIVECPSFETSCQAIDEGKADLTLIAIENSQLGLIKSNISLMEKYRLRPIDEVTLPIRLHIMAKSGITLKDVTVLKSHPIAFAQCQPHLTAYPFLTRIEVNDTATAARLVQLSETPAAALAGNLSALRYNLEILVNDLQGSEPNFTKFFLLEKQRNNSLS